MDEFVHPCDSRVFDTPLGRLRLTGDGRAVCEIAIADGAPGTGNAPYLAEAEAQILAYLRGERRELDFPIDPRGTAFQKRVWAALREIPYGKTQTYGELARSIGVPGGARAVGNAAGKNPCLMIIPCHRLVAAHSLGGFSAGLEVKKTLLHLEGSL